MSPPISLADDNSDSYELRRPRSGFIYILAANIDGCGSHREITAKASLEQAWYIYHYHAPETAIKLKPSIHSLDYCFTQFRCEDEDIYKKWGRAKALPQPHIPLSQLIKEIEIMYSDFELPLAFLDELVTNNKLRGNWMKKFNIQSPDNKEGTTVFNKIVSLVKDFSTDISLAKNSQNYMFWAPTGKISNEFDNIKISDKGVVVAFPDIVGISRDLVSYIQYLENKKSEKLAKYEYAISTAMVIDEYVKTKNIKEKLQIIHRYSNPFKTMEEAYNDELISLAAKSHLNNSENDIINALKQEFELTDIPGYNTIHKVANIPRLFSQKFDNIFKAHLKLIKENEPKLKEFLAIYNKNEEAQDLLNGFCLYAHGLLWGLNATTLGKQCMIQAFESQNKALSEKIKSQIKPFTNDLSTIVTTINAGLTAMASVQEIRGLNAYAYDKIVSALVAEIITGDAYRNTKGILYPRSHTISNITTVYRKLGFSLKEYEMDELSSVLKGNIKILNPSRTPVENRSVILERSTRLEVHDETYHQFTQSAGKLSGLVKLLAFSSFIGYWTETETYTRQGKLANDSTYALMLAFASYMAPEGSLALEYTKTGTLDISLQAINRQTGLAFTSRWAAMRAGFMDASFALSGIAVLFEVWLAQEAAYKGDDIAFWGAVSRGVGTGMLGVSRTLLGVGATSITQGYVISGTILQIIGRVFPYIGAVLLTVGKDIELWVKNGFWGNSDNYWGESIKGYEWSLKREDEFDVQWKDAKNNSNEVHHYFDYEFQKLFSLTDKPILARVDKNNIRIIHPNIKNELITQQIEISQKIVSTNNDAYELKSNLSIKYEKEGSAIISMPDEWEIYDQYNQIIRSIERRYLENIKLVVSMPRYYNSTGDKIYSNPISSNLHDL
ncbi:toxin VasX [Aggregatibacter actinomycetemcomitans]|uniref:toxin VasX n=1 Tax=Aggregatibacter actinomycetemcomitans TaxID=714 RepID=UPI0027E1B518|nr:toxin VasX [Aggregatibacter actinomycetemcomitans]